MSLRIPALRYYGGKFRIAPWIISNFPPHACYCEPYGSAASVLLTKPPSYIDVYNDLDSSIVTFFQVLRDRPKDLVRAIKLTPYSREEYWLSHEPSDDQLETARRVYVRCWQGFGSKQKRSGWRYQMSRSRHMPLSSDWGRSGGLGTSYLLEFAARLRQVQIEHDEATNVIARYDGAETLFYVDPPYMTKLRGEDRPQGYIHDMTNRQHAELAEALAGIQGMAIVSGYDDRVYDELFSGWRKAAYRTRNSQRRSILEFIWISPAAQRYAPQLFTEAL